MQMIPDVLLRTSSNAEGKLFSVLADTDIGDGWTAYHSLNCSEHAYKHWAELDFVLTGPDAILVLEVKGGRVACTNGVWSYQDRFGHVRTNSEGPYGQARSGMYALQKLLVERYRVPSLTSGDASFGFGVVFPDIDWSMDTPECPAAITADREMVLTAAGAARYLRGLVRYWTERHATRRKLTAEDLRTLKKQLRPDVDVYPPLAVSLGAAISSFTRLTEEQYERLELLEQNDRAIVHGGAGTGKTFLLMQHARRNAARGASVCVVVHSSTLAAHLRSQLPARGISVVAMESSPKDAVEPADLLLVDEGQDLMTMDVLADVAGRVKGGLDEGRWCWFMDANNQTGVVGRFEDEAYEYLRTGLSSGRPVTMPLRRNCRNTKEIVKQVQLWTGADIGVTEVSGQGERPRVSIASDDAAAAQELVRRIRDCLDRGAEAGAIGIITDGEEEPACFREVPYTYRKLFTKLTSATAAAALSGRIVWGPASGFKGLERPIVIVLALARRDYEQARASLYVSLTRANYALFLITNQGLAQALNAEQARNGKTMLPEGSR